MSPAHSWGSTQADRTLAFPCDALLPDGEALYRAIDVDAPSPVLFRWLCQLRVAPYSYDWIDNFGRQSPPTLTHGVEALEIGQSIMSIFDLVAFEPNRHLTMRLRRAGGLFGDVAVTYLIVPLAADRARLVVKLLWCYPDTPGLGWLAARLLPWGDLVMMRKQLLTLKALAEKR